MSEVCRRPQSSYRYGNPSRVIYHQCKEDAKQSRADCTPDQTPKYQHITFDFAQQARIPHNAREVGAL